MNDPLIQEIKELQNLLHAAGFEKYVEIHTVEGSRSIPIREQIEDALTELKAQKHIIDHLRLEVERLQQEHQFLVRMGVKIPTTVEEVEIAETVLGKDEKIRNLTLIHEEHKRSIKRLREILQLKPGEDLQDALRALIEERDWLKAYYDDRNSPSVAPGI
jgi:organic radical activating enzyme